VAARAARMIERRSRRATVPGLHLPLLWLPRAVNALVGLLAFRPRGMKALMLELAHEDLQPARNAPQPPALRDGTAAAAQPGSMAAQPRCG
jgi:hypothetical protein